MSTPEPTQMTAVETTDSDWRGPFPGTVLDWFTLFQNHALTGLFFLGFADIFVTLASGPMSLALYVALRRINRPWLTLAALSAFVGIAVYLATNMAFSMLSLSRQYAAATTDVQHSSILAAGQTLLAVIQGTGPVLGLGLVWLAGLIFSIAMLRSEIFGKVTAYVGLAGFALLLASLPFSGYTSAPPGDIVMMIIVSVTNFGGGLLSLVWYILSARRLLQLGRREHKMLS